MLTYRSLLIPLVLATLLAMPRYGLAAPFYALAFGSSVMFTQVIVEWVAHLRSP